MSDEARYALMLSRKPYDGPRRHGKHCFCHECLQDEINAKNDRIEELEKELSEAHKTIDEMWKSRHNL